MSARLIFLLILLAIGARTRAQTTPPSPEKFVNSVLTTVIDSGCKYYYLVKESDTCRFVRFDYDEWADHHLLEPVPISVMNELAKKVYLSHAPYFWKNDSLGKAVCVTSRKADSIILYPSDSIGSLAHTIYSFSLPQFTDDGQYAVIDMNYVCGDRCGLGITYIFRHTPKGWKMIGDYRNWSA